MALQRYALCNVFVAGIGILAEEVSCRLKRSTNSQAVATVAKGYAGESPGAAMIEIEVDNAVPSADFELNPGRFMTNLSTAEVTFAFSTGGPHLTVKGFIVEDSFSHSVNNASSLSFTFRGPYTDWSTAVGGI